MTKISFPYRMSLRYFRKLLKYLVIIVILIFINYTMYIIVKPLRYKLRSNSRAEVPNLENHITQLVTTSTKKPEVEACQIYKTDNILESSNYTGLGLVKEHCLRTYTFDILFESRVKPYPMLVPVNENISESMKSYHLKSCCFRGLIPRKTKTCSVIRLSRETKVPGDLEVIAVECRFDPLGGDSMIFKNIVDVHMFTPLKRGAQKRIKMYKKQKQVGSDEQMEKMNVIILGIGGVSRVDFKREFPETNEYLEMILHAVEMERFNRIGDDMLSNLGPLLTKGSFNGNLGSSFIWQNYANSGYYTLFAEDLVANVTASQSLAKQLKFNATSNTSGPIDYYFPGIDVSSVVNEHDHDEHFHEKFNCYGPRPTFQVMLGFMQKMISRMTTMKHSNFFQFAWLSSPSFLEDDMYLKSFLEWCHQSGHFNNTLLILLSDQKSGQADNNPPLMQILMPFTFQTKYPTAHGNLLNNRKRLTTVRDIYQTLLHILQPSKSLKNLIVPHSHSKQLVRGGGGISLFLSIPKNRTCKTANIPVKHCPCNRYMEILSLNHSSVEPAATFSISSINSLVAIKSNGSSCAYLYLSQILEAKLFYFLDGQDENEYFLITFQTSPGNGTFQALVSRRWENGKEELHLSGNILRSNSHRNESSCLHSPENNDILMYCYCIHESPSLSENNTIKNFVEQ